MIGTQITKFAIPSGFRSDYELCMLVDHCVKYALGEGGYERHELPVNAADFGDLWTYYAEWRNGGHSVYREITAVGAWKRVSALLGEIGLSDNKVLIEDFIDFSVEHEDFIEDMHESGEEKGASRLFWNFDERLYKIEKEKLPLDRACCDWLLKQGWIVLDSTLSINSNEHLRLLSPHPLAEQRKKVLSRKWKAETGSEMATFLARLRKALSRKK